MNPAERMRRKEIAKQHNVELDMVLPEDCTCGDCRHAKRCEVLLGSRWSRHNEYCDWSPARFMAQLRTDTKGPEPS
jgi:hypothetical protein